MVSLWAYDCAKKFNINKNQVSKCIISEYDSQISKNLNRNTKLFINTWSPDGYLEEVHSPVEGHDRGKYYLDDKTSGYKTLTVSLLPHELVPFEGFTVRHSEAITIHNIFPNATIFFCYSSCPESVESLVMDYNEMRPIIKEKIIHYNEIKQGKDELGVWISDGKEKLIWYGSVLGNDDFENFINKKYLNATSIQVSYGGLLIAFKTLCYCLQNKIYKLMFPEDIIQFDNFNKWLKESNDYLKIEIIDQSKNKNPIIKKFINMKRLKDHII